MFRWLDAPEAERRGTREGVVECEAGMLMPWYRSIDSSLSSLTRPEATMVCIGILSLSTSRVDFLRLCCEITVDRVIVLSSSLVPRDEVLPEPVTVLIISLTCETNGAKRGFSDGAHPQRIDRSISTVAQM